MSDHETHNTSDEALYTRSAPQVRGKRTRWILIGSAAVLLAGGVTTAVLLSISSGTPAPSNLLTLDSVLDTTPDSVPDTLQPTTSTEVLDSSPLASPGDSTVPTTDASTPGSSVPQSRPVRVSVNLVSSSTAVAGTTVTYTIVAENPGEVDKEMRIASGYRGNSAAVAVGDLRVSGCPGWRGGINSIYIGLSNIVLGPSQTCTVSFNVSTNPLYSGSLTVVGGVYDDTMGTEAFRTARTVSLTDPTDSTSTTTPEPTTTTTTVA